SAHGHADDEGGRGAAVAVVSFAVAAVLRDVVLLVLEVEQGGQALGCFQHDVAAVPAVAAVGPAARDVLLPAKAPDAVAPVPRLHVNLDLINKIHGSLPCHSERSEESQFAGPVASHPDVLAPFRRRSPADSAVGSSAPPGAHAPPPAPPPYPPPGPPVAFLNAPAPGGSR